MVFKPMPGFKSLTTHHCVTGSMRHIYEFHDYPISEDWLLGLGSGVGFVYWHMKGTPPFIGGRANVERPGEEGLEKTAGGRTGVRIESFQTSSARKAEKALVEMLAAGEPVMLHVDMGFPPYFDLPEGYHFGAHVVVVCGYDHETRQLLIADRDEELHPVSMEDLEKARSSAFKPFPPRHKWYTFDFNEKRQPTADEVRQAIAEQAKGMLEPPITNLGVKGIRKAAKRTLEWSEIMDEEQLRFACFNAFIFIDATGGTGGGLFRYMFSRFLGEAGTVTNDARLLPIADEFQRIGDKWQITAEVFKRASKADTLGKTLSEISSMLLELAELEETVWSRLREIVR